MDTPEELIEAVAEVLWNGDSEPFISWANLAEPVREMQRDAARRVLAVPAIADALARDAKVAEAAVALGAREAMALPEVAVAFRDAARLRSLAATFDNRLNRDKTYTGAQVAAMLRDGEG